jgi:DNA-binding GntR family transcriptional regulator
MTMLFDAPSSDGHHFESPQLHQPLARPTISNRFTPTCLRVRRAGVQMRMGIHAVATSERRIADVLTEHRAIVEGVRSADPERVAAAMTEHLARTLIVLRLPVVSPLARRAIR